MAIRSSHRHRRSRARSRRLLPAASSAASPVLHHTLHRAIGYTKRPRRATRSSRAASRPRPPLARDPGQVEDDLEEDHEVHDHEEDHRRDHRNSPKLMSGPGCPHGTPSRSIPCRCGCQTTRGSSRLGVRIHRGDHPGDAAGSVAGHRRGEILDVDVGVIRAVEKGTSAGGGEDEKPEITSRSLSPMIGRPRRDLDTAGRSPLASSAPDSADADHRAPGRSGWRRSRSGGSPPPSGPSARSRSSSGCRARSS